MAGRLRFALYGAAILVATAIVIAELGRVWPWADEVNAVLLPLLAAQAVVAALAAACRSTPIIALSLLSLALGGGHVGADLLRGAPAGHGPVPIHIVSVNAFRANPTPAEVREVLDKMRPDIALIQESNGSAASEIERALPGYHRIRSCPWRRCSLVVLSRWPIRTVPLPKPPRQDLADLLGGEITIGRMRLRVITVHLPRPGRPSRQRHFDQLIAAVRAQTPLPLIVGGDFNTPSGSFRLARFAQAAKVRRVDGWIATYPADGRLPAFLTIDHIFVDRQWTSGGCSRVTGTGSDHYAINCRLYLDGQRATG